jgi:putative ABC transport system substrate-binding protein
MRRREFVTLVGGAAVAWPLAARAQQSAMPVIGFLNSRAPGENETILVAFRRGLKEVGYVGGQNVTVEYRWADNQYERLPALAADLVGRRVAVIVSNGPPIATAKAATSTIPIVFVVGFDALTFGLVTSLNRPSGNLTGVSVLDVELGPKRLELLHELIPAATVMALLVNSSPSSSLRCSSRSGVTRGFPAARGC